MCCSCSCAAGHWWICVVEAAKAWKPSNDLPNPFWNFFQLQLHMWQCRPVETLAAGAAKNAEVPSMKGRFSIYIYTLYIFMIVIEVVLICPRNWPKTLQRAIGQEGQHATVGRVVTQHPSNAEISGRILVSYYLALLLGPKFHQRVCHNAKPMDKKKPWKVWCMLRDLADAHSRWPASLWSQLSTQSSSVCFRHLQKRSSWFFMLHQIDITLAYTNIDLYKNIDEYIYRYYWPPGHQKLLATRHLHWKKQLRSCEDIEGPDRSSSIKAPVVGCGFQDVCGSGHGTSVPRPGSGEWLLFGCLLVFRLRFLVTSYIFHQRKFRNLTSDYTESCCWRSVNQEMRSRRCDTAEMWDMRIWRVGSARNAVFFHSFVVSPARKVRS